MSNSRPKIVLNMTTLNQGGVLQRAYSFINNLSDQFAEFEWHLLLSTRVNQEIRDRKLSVNLPVQIFPVSPAKNWRARKAIVEAIKKIQPDLVFTFAGPSYLTHRWPELMGVADGWVTHSTKAAFDSVPSFRHRFGLRLSAYYKLRWFRQSKWFTSQTETGKQGIAERFGVPADQVYIIPNALANWYEIAATPTLREPGETLKIFYFAAAYSHKRHDILPAVCRELRSRGETNFEILITLPEENPLTKAVMAQADEWGVRSHIVNIGSVPVTKGMELYQQSHICFVPSILETFSATYLEGMATRTPIVACDLPFAREICDRSALYFDPNNVRDAVDKILQIVNDRELTQRLTETGTQQLQSFPDVPQQMEIYRSVFQHVLARTKEAVPIRSFEHTQLKAGNVRES